MKVHKNFLGTGGQDKIHVDEIAVAPGLLLGGAVIVESGSNADGEYVRFGDGLQICWRRYGTSVPAKTTVTYDWIFPKTFISAPILLCGGGAGTSIRLISYGFNLASSATLPNKATAVLYNDHTNAQTIVIHMGAIGRWK